jgi:hypothetical protein
VWLEVGSGKAALSPPAQPPGNAKPLGRYARRVCCNDLILDRGIIGGAFNMSVRKVCETCGKEMEIIFILTSVPLYVIPGERVLKSIHSGGQDIFQNKWWRHWLPTLAKYIMGFRCGSCQTIWLDYGKTYNEKEAQAIIRGE